mmetsp:Transcript_21490/g.50142  ORF Transcript_21490/g.50142 Transcript_21490/m.50142 type:complete len:273 (+) Transcript_21490:1024-1842(+)
MQRDSRNVLEGTEVGEAGVERAGGLREQRLDQRRLVEEHPEVASDDGRDERLAGERAGRAHVKLLQPRGDLLELRFAHGATEHGPRGALGAAADVVHPLQFRIRRRVAATVATATAQARRHAHRVARADAELAQRARPGAEDPAGVLHVEVLHRQPALPPDLAREPRGVSRGVDLEREQRAGEEELHGRVCRVRARCVCRSVAFLRCSGPPRTGLSSDFKSRGRSDRVVGAQDELGDASLIGACTGSNLGTSSEPLPTSTPRLAPRPRWPPA